MSNIIKMKLILTKSGILYEIREFDFPKTNFPKTNLNFIYPISLCSSVNYMGMFKTMEQAEEYLQEYLNVDPMVDSEMIYFASNKILGDYSNE